MNKNIALIGNPNSGKTTLFNLLTGLHRRTGNRTGVTVDEGCGTYKRDKSVKIADLPGVYSLSPISADEICACNYLKNNKPDVIINIVDGTNLERHLNLTLLLKEYSVPMVVAINMADEVAASGTVIDEKKLSENLGVPVVLISARKNKNVNALMEKALSITEVPEITIYEVNGESEEEKRFAFISKILKDSVKTAENKKEKLTIKIDNVVTNKIFGLPIFIGIIFCVYFFSFKIGGIFSGNISALFDKIVSKIGDGNPWLSLLSAICKGVGTVAEFLPHLIALYLFLALLEESGYMARVSFIVDRFFRSFGLGGKSVIPLVLSCGCTVTGITAARIIENEDERAMTIILSPFLPCGAKAAVFGWLSYQLFGGNALIATSLYLLGIFVVAVCGKILSVCNGKKNEKGFLLEMPVYRIPDVKSVIFLLLDRLKEFLLKAGTVIFSISILLWLLQNFGFGGYVYGQTEKSFLYGIGNAIKFIFYPLGFGNWQASVAIISGLLAREAVAETISLVCSDPSALFDTVYSAYAFLAFVLLSVPCIATVAQAKRELNDNKTFVFMLAFEFLTGYIVALIINIFGKIISEPNGLIFFVFGCIIIVTVIVGLYVILKPKKCNCKRCTKGECKCKITAKRNTTI